MTDSFAALDEAWEKAQDRPLPTARAALATLGAGVAAALLVPGSPAGLGLAIASVAVLAGAAFELGGRRDVWRTTILIGAAALAVTPLIRDAQWLVTLDLVAALFFAAVAVVPGRSWAALGRAPFSWFAAAHGGPMSTLRAASERSALPSARAIGPAVRGVLLATVLVTVFAALFATADGAFAHLAGQLSPDLSFDTLIVRIAVGALAFATAGALVALPGAAEPDAWPDAPERLIGPVEWTIALCSLIALFAAFVTVQFVVLFGGDEHVLRTAGLTYADYAHQGFGQLLLVAFLVLGVVGTSLRYCRADSRRQQRLRSALLLALGALTLVIVASALHRLDIYVDAFGSTRTRLVAEGICVWVGAVLVTVLVSLVWGDRAWLPRGIVLVTVALALGFTAVNPDGQVAARNVERFEATGAIDIDYNGALSADATPTLARLPAPLAGEVLARQSARLDGSDGLLGFNVARSKARHRLGE